MPLKTLIVIALRLYTIYWVIESMSELAVVALMLVSFGSMMAAPKWYYQYALVPLGMLLISVILWVFSSKLSAQIIKGHDTQLTFTSLTREDIYRFAFVFLGVFFVLSSLFSLIETGYQFFAYDYPQPDSNPEKGRYLWLFLGHAFTMIAGFVCVFGAGNWTKKLIRFENKNEAPPPAV